MREELGSNLGEDTNLTEAYVSFLTLSIAFPEKNLD
jgi:hypothetical protein